MEHAPAEAASPGDFERMLWARGQAHEREVLERFPGAVGPIWSYGESETAAAEETRHLLHETRAPLYQPMLLSTDGKRAGVPDFLYWNGPALVIHEAKLAVHPGDHPEIGLQMAHYAQLLVESAGLEARQFEMTNGHGEVVPVRLPTPADYAHALERAAALIGADPEPTLLKSHSCCSECPFYQHCWPRAARERRVEILTDVTSIALPRLRELGVRTIDELASRDPRDLVGPGIQGTATRMVKEAQAHRDGRLVWLQAPELPAHRPRVWLDLEGDPEGEDVDNAIYLWGLALEDGGSLLLPESILADFGAEGDRAAWERFVARAEAIFERHPDALWVHYANYEATWIKRYLERYPPRRRFAERMLGSFHDLLDTVRRSVRIPGLYSYSIKKVAPVAGFEWSDPDSGSLWSIVQYHRAREVEDPAERRRILDSIVRYNEDDLLAMRAVWNWLEAEWAREAAARAAGGTARAR